MKRLLLCSLISCVFVAACAPQKQTVYRQAPFPRDDSAIEVPPAPEAPAATSDAEALRSAPPQAPAATPAPKQKREVLYGIPEPGRPGYVRSPYNPQGGLLDCRGYPPGTEMKDEYAPGKTFLVP